MKRLLIGLLVLAATSAAQLPGGPAKLTAEQQKALAALEVKLEQAARKGDFEEGERLAREVVSLRAKWQGERHWQTIDARYNAEDWQRLMKVPRKDREQVIRARRVTQEGVGLFNRGQYKGGLEKLVEALAIRQKALGEAHPAYASSLSNLAALYQALGDYDKALPLFEQARDLRKKLLTENHPDYAASLDNLAGLYQARAEYAKALPLYEQARDLYKKLLTENHPIYATSLNNLALLYRDMGDYAKALPLCEKALALDPKNAEAHCNLGHALREQGRFASALQAL
jgi:tetratricopeptide (TPR) repeat protein